MGAEENLKNIRSEKIRQMREAGTPPYPNRFRRKALTGELSSTYRDTPGDALEELVRYLPLLPNDLLKDGDTALWRRFQKRQLNWQKNTHSRLRQPDKKPGAGAAATAAM